MDTGTAGSAATHPAAEVTADENPDGRAPETGAPAEPSGRADAGPDDGDAADDEVLGDRQDAPSAPARPHPSDADTPPYGFPAVTEQDVAAAQNGSRMPTLLSAPVPADVAAAPEAEPGDVAAKGRPPAASLELSGTQAELAHEDQPAKKPPTPFERVRSTPTRPAAPQPEEDGAA